MSARLAPGFLLAAALALLALGGCPKRYDFGPQAYADPRALLEAVRQAHADPQALTGEARIRVTTGAGRFGADHFVAARRPAALRLETLSFFGNPLALVLVHEGQMLLWDVGNDRAFTGPATAENLGAVAPVGLGPEAVVGVLLGMPPLLVEAEARLFLDHARRAYRVVLASEKQEQVLHIDPGTMTLLEVAWFQGKERLARLTYGRYRRRGRGLFPYELAYEARGGERVEVSWREVDVGAELADALFQVTLPESVRVQPFEAAPPPGSWLPEEPATPPAPP